MPTFEHDGQKIAYTEYGGGPAAVVTASGRRRARSAGAPRPPIGR